MRYESKTKTKACPPNGGAASTKSKFNGGGATQCRHNEIGEEPLPVGVGPQRGCRSRHKSRPFC